jgi:hypothetical protein
MEQHQINIASCYLAAMIDAEGSIVYQPKKSNRAVVIYNTELQIINKCIEYLNYLQIESYIVKTKRQCKFGESLHLIISNKRNLEKLYSYVNIYMCNRKKTMFEDMMLSYKYKATINNY